MRVEPVLVSLGTLSVAIGVGALVLAGCGHGGDRATVQSGGRCGDEDQLALVPDTYRDGSRVVLPVVFPDGTRAELTYPPELAVAELGVFPYSSGSLRGRSPIPGRGDTVGRDFWVRCGELSDVRSLRNDGRQPALLAEYKGADGQAVGLWKLRANDPAHYLGFKFGRWAVLVYDYVGAGAMTDPEPASWAASFSGRETGEGFLILEGTGPLRLARAREHAGPELVFAAGNPTRDLALFPGECRAHRDQTRLINGKHVQWSGGFADWCLSNSMRIHASGPSDFVGAVIRKVAVRNVTIAS